MKDILYEKLFDLAVHCMLGEGGDGSIQIVCELEPIEVVANRFSVWLCKSPRIRDFWKVKGEINSISFITFYHYQESICFTEKEIGPKYMYEYLFRF